MLTMWTFYCGLVDFSNGVERLQKFPTNYDTTYYIQLAFESQQTVVCDFVVRIKSGQFKLFFLRFVDIPALGYVIGNTSLPVTKLSLDYRSMNNDDGITALLQALEFNKENLHNLQVLILTNLLNGAHVTLLASVLKACTRLTRARFRLKNIDSDSTSYLTDGLTYLFHLTNLTIHCEGSTPGAITVLLDGLQHLNNVVIQLRFAQIRISDVVELGRGLVQHTINRVRKLELQNSSIGAEGTSALASGLPKLTELVYLDLSHNDIDDDGVTSLATGIKHNFQLRYLNLSHNNIGPCGATSLAGAIACLKNLTDLNLEHNNIGPEGATALAAALQHHKNLLELKLSCNNIGPEGAIRLANALPHLEKLRQLRLSSNNIDLASATAVIIALKNCQWCHTAYINKDHNRDPYFGVFEVKDLVAPNDTDAIAALVAAVQHDTRRQVLDLGFDRIDVPPKNC